MVAVAEVMEASGGCGRMGHNTGWWKRVCFACTVFVHAAIGGCPMKHNKFNSLRRAS